MKKKNLLVLGLLMLNISMNAAAGDRGGNGGDGILCGDQVVMLDYIEMEKRNFQLELPGNTIRKKVGTVIERVIKVDPYRATELSKYSAELLSDIEKRESNDRDLKFIDFTSDVLSDVPDSLEISLPRGCTKHQLVTQQNPVFPEDKRYTIAEDLFDKMDIDQKALMVLHESWYRIFLNEGAKDSRFARYINGVFASKKHQMNVLEYFELLNRSEKIGGVDYKFNYNLNGQIVELHTVYFRTDEVSIHERRRILNYDELMKKLVYSKFDENGNITLGVSSKKPMKVSVGTGLVNIEPTRLTLNRNNEIVSTRGYLTIDSDVSLTIQNVRLELDDFYAYAVVEYTESGKILSYRGTAKALYQDNKLIQKTSFMKSFLEVDIRVIDGQVHYKFF